MIIGDHGEPFPHECAESIGLIGTAEQSLAAPPALIVNWACTGVQIAEGRVGLLFVVMTKVDGKAGPRIGENLRRVDVAIVSARILSTTRASSYPAII